MSYLGIIFDSTKVGQGSSVSIVSRVFNQGLSVHRGHFIIIISHAYCRSRQRSVGMSPNMMAHIGSRTVPSPYQQLEDSTVIIEGSVTGGHLSHSEKVIDQYYDFDEAASIAPSDVDIRKYYKGMEI